MFLAHGHRSNLPLSLLGAALVLSYPAMGQSLVGYDGSYFVCNGPLIASYTADGAVTEACSLSVWGFGPIRGAAYVDLGGGVSPSLAGSGYAQTGSAGFSLVVSQVPFPFATYQLLYTDSSVLCPAIPVLGLQALIAPPIHAAGSATTDLSGTAPLPVTIPHDPAFTISNG